MTTVQNLQIRLAGGRFGRVTLHVICSCRDHKWRWHICGILREMRGLVTLWERLMHAAGRSARRATDVSAAVKAVTAVHETVVLRNPATRLV